MWQVGSFSTMIVSVQYKVNYNTKQNIMIKFNRNKVMTRSFTLSNYLSILTLKVLNFWTFIETWSGWIFDSYCSLKPLCSGMGEIVPARTSPTLPPPSPRTVL